tara:strand:+ start:188 stop:514 length:327 start_codon:yes stop_codon:yes gene_type:complete
MNQDKKSYKKNRRKSFQKGLKESDEKLRRELKSIKDQSEKRIDFARSVDYIGSLEKRRDKKSARSGLPSIFSRRQADPDSNYLKREAFAKSEQKKRKAKAYAKAAARR